MLLIAENHGDVVADYSASHVLVLLPLVLRTSDCASAVHSLSVRSRELAGHLSGERCAAFDLKAKASSLSIERRGNCSHSLAPASEVMISEALHF